MIGYFLRKKNVTEEHLHLKEKVEGHYENYAKQYGSKVFNVDAFHERYQRALKLDAQKLKGFLLSELEAMTSFIAKHSTTLSTMSIGNKTSTSPSLEVYQAYAKRLHKYPSIAVHPKASSEIERLYGALRHVYEAYYMGWAKIRSVLNHSKADSLYYQADAYVNELLPVFTSQKPKAFRDYAKTLDRPNITEEDIELAGQQLLKKTFHMIEALKACLNALLEVARRRSFVAAFVVQGKSYSFLEYEEKLRQELNGLLKDFRLRGLL